MRHLQVAPHITSTFLKRTSQAKLSVEADSDELV